MNEPMYITKAFAKDTKSHGLGDIISFITETSNKAFEKGYLLAHQNITQVNKEFTIFLTFKKLRNE